MKISRDWLSDYIDLGNHSDDELARRFTEIGHAVESYERHGEDTVFEIEFTTNRIDAMSHYGLARDLAAALGTEVRNAPKVTTEPSAAPSIPITIEAPELCTRYSAQVIRGVTVRPSSEKVQRRLEAVGLRPINNLVDATNYVMAAVGHPLHAFDLALLAGPAIRVIRGTDGEKMRSLDSVERQIDRETVIIADAEKSVGIGGIIGGENSEIRPDTKDVLLECAHFTAPAIRRTARRMGIKTDASYRFERGADPNDTLAAISMARDLIVAEAGGEAGELIDVVAAPVAPKRLTLREEKLHEQSGGQIGAGYALELFTRLGFQPVRTRDAIEVTIPTYRVDIHEEMDLIEEVLRFFGFNSIKSSLPRLTTGDSTHDAVADAEEKVRDLLASAGLTEVITYSFIAAEENRRITDERPLDLINALTEQINSMRLSILPGLLHAIVHNRAYGNRDGALFEVGRTYHGSADHVEERRTAAFVLFGNKPGSWSEAKQPYDFFDAKGIVETVAENMRVRVTSEPSTEPWLKKGQASRIVANEKTIGRVGVVSPEILHAFGVKGEVIAGEIDLHELVGNVDEWRMAAVSKYPGVPMVLGMLHGRELRFQQIVETIRGLDVPFLQEVGIWDRFVPEKSEAGAEVKTAIALWYQSTDRSLTQAEVAEAHQRLTERVAAMLPVRIITT